MHPENLRRFGASSGKFKAFCRSSYSKYSQHAELLRNATRKHGNNIWWGDEGSRSIIGGPGKAWSPSHHSFFLSSGGKSVAENHGGADDNDDLKIVQ